MRPLLIALSSLSLLATPAGAVDLLEVRAGYLAAAVSPDDFNRAFISLSPDLEMEATPGFSVDARLALVILPIRFGVRYEFIGNSSDLRVNTRWDVDSNRVSALVDYRFLDGLAFLGPVATLGFQTGHLTVESLGVEAREKLTGQDVSWSAALDGGLNLKGWILSLELGYLGYGFTADRSALDVDLSGLYGRLSVGRRFGLHARP